MIVFFYLFAFLLVISSLFVVTSKHPVYSVLWLIFAFCNASGLMVLLGAEFLSMMLIIIYVGAVAVLFLFVVMMLDLNWIKLKMQVSRNMAMNFFLSLVLFVDLVAVIIYRDPAKMHGQIVIANQSNIDASSSFNNTKAIGAVLYTDFILPFQISGIILFMAIISCITLTMKGASIIKRQDKLQQLKSNKKNVISLVHVENNAGVKNIKYE